MVFINPLEEKDFDSISRSCSSLKWANLRYTADSVLLSLNALSSSELVLFMSPLIQKSSDKFSILWIEGEVALIFKISDLRLSLLVIRVSIESLKVFNLFSLTGISWTTWLVQETKIN